jgi:flavin-dependent dehydrogenase
MPGRTSGPAPETPTLGDRVRAQALSITGMTVSGPGRAQVTARYPRGLRGAAITRSTLDAVLLEAAIEAGAEFEPAVRALGPVLEDGRVTGVRVTGRGRGTPLGSRVVIAADGRGSRVASLLRLSRLAPWPRRWAFGAYFSDVDGLSSCGEMHIRRGGYIGVAPMPGGLANVCVVRERPNRGATRIDRDRVIGEALEAEPMLRDRFASARAVSAVASLGPLGVDARAAGMPGLLLAGDAAGFVDPMTGDGLRFALRGGILAAEGALAELESGRPACEALRAARAGEFSRKWRINRALRSLAGSPRALVLAAAAARRWAAPVEYLIGVAGDVDLVPVDAALVTLDRGRAELQCHPTRSWPD